MEQALVREKARARLAHALTEAGREDREAFRLLYRLTSAKLFGICLRICGDRSAAEDVLADVYLVIWKRAASWNPERGSAIAWLSTIAHNRAIDWRRRQIGWQVELRDRVHLVDATPNAEAVLLSEERKMQVRRCLDALAPHEQSAIRDAFYKDLRYSELATRAGVPLSTMKSWIRRGLLKMRADFILQNEETQVPPSKLKVLSEKVGAF